MKGIVATIWIILLFSGTRMITRFYSTRMTLVLIIYYGYLFLKGELVITKNQFIFVILDIYVLASSFWSISFDSTLLYMPNFLLSIFFISKKEDIEEKEIFYLVIEIISFLIMASILIETFDGTFVYDHLWFLFEHNKGAASYLLEMKLGEKYIGAFSGIIGEKADAAFLIVIGLVLVWCNILLKLNVKGIFKIRYYLECVLLYVALFLTGKRTLFVCSIMIVFVLLVIYKKVKPEQISNKVVLILGLLFLILFIAQFFEGTSTMFERLKITRGEDTALQVRKEAWNVCKALFRKYPLLGGGFASFVKYCTDNYFFTNTFAHNIYWEWLGELGIVGAIIAIAWGIVMIKILVGNYKKLEKMSNEQVFQYAFSTVIFTVIVIYGFTGNCLYYQFQFLWLLWSSKILLTLYEL